jgi:hypothetical protein
MRTRILRKRIWTAAETAFVVANYNRGMTAGQIAKTLKRTKNEEQRKIASAGGRAAHQQGTAHEFTSDEARVVGRLGGHRCEPGSRPHGGDRSARRFRDGSATRPEVVGHRACLFHRAAFAVLTIRIN